LKNKERGFVIGIFLFIFFIVYSFKNQLYLHLVENYSLVLEELILWIPKLIIIILIFVVAYLLRSFFDSLIKQYFQYVGKEFEYKSASSIVKYVVWVIALIAALAVAIGNLGVWITSMGLVGFGITFALQKPILNIVGWVTIMFNQTYKLGDRVQMGDVKGDVVEIQVMYTVLDGILPNTDEPSGKTITLPNELVLTGSVVNFTKSGDYLWEELSIQITYESDWKKAEKMLKEIAFKIVNKYVGNSSHETTVVHKSFKEMIFALNKSHSQAKTRHERELIEGRIKSVNSECNRYKIIHNEIVKDKKKEPIVRVELTESSVGLNVRYLAHYKFLKIMKSEINTEFLKVIAKYKSISVAYPHIQIVRK